MQKNHLFILLPIVGVIIAGGSFAAGMTYARRSTTLVPSNRTTGFDPSRFTGERGNLRGTGNMARFGGQGGPGGVGFIAGEVLSKDTNSLTVKMNDGGSKIIFFATSTRIGKTTDGSLNDIAQGSAVTINGSPNADGSMTASMIQIRPALPRDTDTPR